MKRTSKQPFVITTSIVIVIAAIAVLLTFVEILLPKVVDEERYRLEIQRWLSNELGRDVRAEKIDLHLLTGPKIVLRDVTIDDDLDFSAESFINTKKLIIHVRFLPLFKGELVVRKLVFKDSTTSIIERGENNLNIHSLSSGDVESSVSEGMSPVFLASFLVFPLKEKAAHIKEISFKDLRVIYTRIIDDNPEEIFHLKGIDLVISNISPPQGIDFLSRTKGQKNPFSYHLYTSIPTCFIDGVLLEDIVLNGDFQGGLFTLDDLSLELCGGTLHSSGYIDFSSEPTSLSFDAHIEDVMANKALRTITNDEGSCFGVVSLEGAFNGSGNSLKEIIDNLSGEGIISVKEGHITSFSIRGELLSYDLIGNSGLPDSLDTSFTALYGNFSLMENKLELSSLTMRSPEWDAVAKGDIGLDGSLELDGDVFLSDTVALEIKPEYFDPLMHDHPDTRLSIPFSIRGDIYDLEFFLRPEFLTEKDAEDILEEFQRGIEERFREGFTIKLINNTGYY